MSEESPARPAVGFALNDATPRRWRAVCVRITVDEHDLLRSFADERGMTLSNVVRAGLTEALHTDAPSDQAAA